MSQTGPLSAADVDALNGAAHPSPFDVLGPHKFGGKRWISTVQPDAADVVVVVGGKETTLPRVAGDVFSGPVPGKAYSFKVTYGDGHTLECLDAYAFGPVLSDFDQYLIGEGTHRQLWRALGAHVRLR